MLNKISRIIASTLLGLILVGCGAAVAPEDIETAQYPIYGVGRNAFLNGDYTTAMAHLLPLAREGNSGAQFFVGYMHDDVSSKFLNLERAFYWYGKSARKGNTAAQNNLANMYWDGKVTEEDYTLAHMWWTISNLINSDPVTQGNLDRLTQYMSPSEIQESIEKANACIASGYVQCD